MRPIFHTRAVRAIALTGTLAVAIPLAAVLPATAQTETPGTQEAVTTNPGSTTAHDRRGCHSGQEAPVEDPHPEGHAQRGRRQPCQPARHAHAAEGRSNGHAAAEPWQRLVDRRQGAHAFQRCVPLVYRTRNTGSVRWRAVFTGDRSSKPVRRSLGRLNMYRRAHASWYALYGGALACGGTLGYNTQGVAHKTLPCGTRLTLRYRGRSVRVRVIDRGPYVGGRDFDLTGATKRSLRFGDLGTVLSTR